MTQYWAVYYEVSGRIVRRTFYAYETAAAFARRVKGRLVRVIETDQR